MVPAARAEGPAVVEAPSSSAEPHFSRKVEGGRSYGMISEPPRFAAAAQVFWSPPAAAPISLTPTSRAPTIRRHDADARRRR